MYNDDDRFREQVGLLIRALRSDLDSVQEIAVVQLSMFGSKIVPYLTEALSTALVEDNNYDHTRYSHSFPWRGVVGIVKVLGIINDPSTVAFVAKALPYPEAVLALAKIGSNEALEAVMGTLETWYEDYVHEEERNKELESVDDFVTRVFSYFGEKGTKALKGLLQRGDPAKKDLAAKIIGSIGDSGSIPALLEALKSRDASVQVESAQALLRLGAKEAVPQMVAELLKTKDYTAQKAISQAVLEFGSLKDWIDVAFSRFRKDRGWHTPISDDFDSAIVSKGEEAMPFLTGLLSNSDPSIQRDAAEMIAIIKRGGSLHKIMY